MLGVGWGKSGRGSKRSVAKDLYDDSLKFEAIINNIEDGVLLIDGQNVIRLCNPGAGQICGWSAEDATGISVEQVITLVDDKGQPVPANESPFSKVFRTGEVIHNNKANLLTREHKQIAISLTITPILTNAQVTDAIAVFRDVSEERAEEQQRADFISTASHEMRTPVAAIEGYLALALNDKVATVDNRARNYLEKAHLSTEHLGHLFQDLLTSAKAEDGRLTSHPVVVELGGFLEQLTNDLRFSAEAKGLFVEFVVGSNTTASRATEGGERVLRPFYYAYADPDRLREVITNLFDNAVKYTDEGKISIGLTGDDQVVQCYVRDSGQGIPAGDVPHVFQKFYRVDNSATRTIGGTGLGLFICRKIIELYNGRIWVESEVGKGSTFYINLPHLNNQKVRELQATATNNPQLEPINSIATP
jgi:PAS domain S-box-containing protein